MSSIKYLSGAEKRKLKQQKDDEVKNRPTIFKFFKPQNDTKSNETINSSFNSNTIVKDLEVEIMDNYEDFGKRKQKRSENQTILSGRKKLEVDTFFIIIDKLIYELDRRLNAYSLFYSQFKFLVNFKTDIEPDIESLNNCIKFYNVDLDDNLKTEINHFYQYIKTISSDIDNCSAIAKLLYERNLIDVFPNVYIALRLYLTIPLTNCEAERSFSKLALIKNRLRSTQVEKRLNALTIMSIENDICKNLSFDDVLDTFATSKSRKMNFT